MEIVTLTPEELVMLRAATAAVARHPETLRVRDPKGKGAISYPELSEKMVKLLMRAPEDGYAIAVPSLGDRTPTPPRSSPNLVRHFLDRKGRRQWVAVQPEQHIGQVYWFLVWDSERTAFPELAEVYQVGLYDTGNQIGLIGSTTRGERLLILEEEKAR